MAFVPLDSEGETSGNLLLTAFMDKQGNGHLVSKLMCSKVLLNVVLMKTVEQLSARRAWMSLQWVPRQQNEEADALSNSSFIGFDPAKRVHVNLENIRWKVLPQLLEAGGSMYQELEAQRAQKIQERQSLKRRKQDKIARHKKLKFSNPW